MSGYTGKILRVDLSTRETDVEIKDDSFYRKNLGGRNLIVQYLLNELPDDTDALSPENLLIFATGVLTGLPVAGCGRNSVGGKSPVTGGYGEAEAGGYFGTELKKAGFDAIVIRGRAENPVYLLIDGQNVSIRSADELWGLASAETRDALVKDTGLKGLRTAIIGPAAEKLVLYSCIQNDLVHVYGRNGLGAVMGSKQLKAVAVKGSGKVPVHDSERIQAVNSWMKENLDHLMGWAKVLGTPGSLLAQNMMGGLPTRNFLEGTFKGAERISGETLHKEFLSGRGTCYACPVKCKQVVQIEGKYNVNPVYGGPEYETIGAFGSLCGVDDLAAICKANELCNALSLDTITTGNVVAFAMELSERDLLPEQLTGGQKFRFGNADDMLELIELIAERKGIGDLFAKGIDAAAEILGLIDDDAVLTIKGQPLPLHEPRVKHGLALGYAVSPTGADHNHNMFDEQFSPGSWGMFKMTPLGIMDPVPTESMDTAKVRMLVYHHFWTSLYNSLVMCIFMPYDYETLVTLVQAATGWDISMLELSKIGERSITAARLFNVRQGLSESDDKLPQRLFKVPVGYDKKSLLDEDIFFKAREQYYGMMGWDEQGVPTAGKLAELQLDQV